MTEDNDDDAWELSSFSFLRWRKTGGKREKTISFEAISRAPLFRESRSKARKWKMETRIKSKSFSSKRVRTTQSPLSSPHFHLSFVCFIYYREMFSPSLLLLASTFLSLEFEFSVSPAPFRLCFISFSPAPTVYSSHFTLQTSTQIYFNPQTRYTKSHFTSAAVAGACHCYEVFKFYFNVCTEH